MIVNNYDDVFTDKRIKIAEVKEWLAKEHEPCSNYLGQYIPVFTSGTTGNSAIFIYDEKDWHYILTPNTLEVLSLRDLWLVSKKNFRIAAIVADYDYGTGINMFRRNKVFKNKKEISVSLPKEKILDNLKIVNPNGIICYASVLPDICEALETGKLKVNPKYIFSTGEYLSNELYYKIKSLLPDCTIFNSYTTTETLVIGLRTKPKQDFQILTNNNIVELLDETYHPVKLNESGTTTVTSLHNLITPIIRYQFSDSAISNESCRKDKLGVATLSSLMGRKICILPIKNNLGKLDKINELRLHLFIDGVKQIQIISDKLNEIQILYTATKNLDAIVSDEFKSILKLYNADNTVKITVKKVSEIPPEKNGKTPQVKVNFNL
ncbi:MAG: hypothetical protein HRU35_05720 [Rickettsiaceae bacterium]|nr:hypothetical protein [Rickettsiaceae bacterium]